MATEVAQAVVTIIPSMKGSQQTIAKELGASVDNAAKKSGKSGGKAFSETFGKALKAGAKAIAAAATTAMAGAVTMAKKAVQAFANYEQLVGGIETLFGTGGKNLEQYIKTETEWINNNVKGAKRQQQAIDALPDKYKALLKAEQDVLKNSTEAWKTAGMSSNQYMETVTSFSAALIKSLDGDSVKAAKIADQAVRDMADNANKMGTAMESIEAAFQGFAKGNYTLLDNLKLGRPCVLAEYKPRENGETLMLAA